MDFRDRRGTGEDEESSLTLGPIFGLDMLNCRAGETNNAVMGERYRLGFKTDPKRCHMKLSMGLVTETLIYSLDVTFSSAYK